MKSNKAFVRQIKGLIFTDHQTTTESNGKIIGAFTDSSRHFVMCIQEKSAIDNSVDAR